MLTIVKECAEIAAGTLVLNRYRIDREIGSGGTGVVWLATDTALDQSVALKRVSFAHLGREQATRLRERTLREARVAARLRGAGHIVALYDVQVADGAVWLVLEYHPSRSLAALFTGRGALDPAEAAEIGADVAEALAHAHAAGILHRDVTPNNVLIGDDGVVKLTDFGIARLLGERPITETGVINGTLCYLAPEVARGDDAGPAADVFSLGATLYRAVEGLPPFGNGGSELQLLHLIGSGNIRPPERSGALTPVLLSMLDPDPASRPAPEELRAQLGRLAGRQEPQATPPHPDRPIRRVRGPGLGRAALVAGALGAVLVLVLVLAPGRSVEGTPVAALPTSGPAQTGPIMLTGDPHTVDTCQLFQPDALREFGTVRLQRGGFYEGCLALLTGRPTAATVEVSMDAAGSGAPPGRRMPLGGISVVRQAANDPGLICENSIELTDRSVIYLSAYPTDARRSTDPDLCALVRIAADTATRVLAARHGLPRAPGVAGTGPLATVVACAIADPVALRTVPGLQSGRRTRGFGDWRCAIGNGRQHAPQVRISFLRTRTGKLASFTDPATVAGRPAFVNTQAGWYNPHECFVRVQYRDPGGTAPAELVGVEVEGTQPVPAMCTAARAIAAGSLRRIPS